VVKVSNFVVFYHIKNKQTNKQAGCWWLIPIILVTQEAEIRRITVESQPGQIDHETLSGKNHHKKKGWWSDSRCRP
jgi:hypothetical protein